MRVITLEDLKGDIRLGMQGARWLILKADEVESSANLLIFTELEDILVAVDHRGSNPPDGLWQRAVHLILIDGDENDAQEFCKKSGITKVIAGSEQEIRTYLW